MINTAIKCGSRCTNLQIKSQYSYDGCNILSLSECVDCGMTFSLFEDKKIEFQKKVNEVRRLLASTAADFLARSESEYREDFKKKDQLEIFAQIIFKTIFPDSNVLEMDNGTINNQFDLLIEKNDQKIAVEVTQIINGETKKIQSYTNNSPWSSDKLNWAWNLILDNSGKYKVDIKKIEELLLKVESNARNNSLTQWNGNHDDQPFGHDFAALGIVSWYGRLTEESGLIRINCMYQYASTVDLDFSIFREIEEKCSAKDNLKKLKMANVHERHIFIPIINKPEACEIFRDHHTSQEYLKVLIAKKLGITAFIIPPEINCIWLARVKEYSKRGRMGFQLIKITNDSEKLLIEKITQAVQEY